MSFRKWLVWTCVPLKFPKTLCTRRTTTHQFIWQKQNTCGALGGSPIGCGVGRQTHKIPHFYPQHWHPPPGMTLPRTAGVRLNRLCTDVGRFRFCLHCTNGVWLPLRPVSVAHMNQSSTMLSSNVQSIDQCPIHHGLHGLTSSGRWDNQMAAQHLPWDLVRPSGYKNWLIRWRSSAYQCKWLKTTAARFSAKSGF